jgi:hypothetical protein
MNSIEDLRHVRILAQNEDGRRVNVNCYECTDKQFDTWARGRVKIEDDDHVWMLQERFHLCKFLWDERVHHIQTTNTIASQGGDCVFFCDSWTLHKEEES